MAYSDTVLKQLLTLVPIYEFDALAQEHPHGTEILFLHSA